MFACFITFTNSFSLSFGRGVYKSFETSSTVLFVVLSISVSFTTLNTGKSIETLLSLLLSSLSFNEIFSVVVETVDRSGEILSERKNEINQNVP